MIDCSHWKPLFFCVDDCRIIGDNVSKKYLLKIEMAVEIGDVRCVSKMVFCIQSLN